MAIEDIFSEDNILSYSEACLDLAVSVPEKQKKANTLVIPSRGAVPFFLGMTYSLDKLKSMGGAQENFYSNLAIQDTLSSLLPENIKLSNQPSRESINVLLVPFTADLNLNKFDKKLDNDEYVLKTRNYWANVTKSFFKTPFERVKDPYFVSFADFVLREVEGREELAQIYEKFPEITKFSIIDTAISGRAATDILGSFDKLAEKSGNSSLVPQAFLVVDEMGDKMKPQFSGYLRKKILEEKVEMHFVPRIVSEDEGASLLGVAAVIYPSIMRASKNFYLNGEEFFIGAGAWHKSLDIPGKYFNNFNLFMNMVYKGIDLLYKKGYSGEESSKEKESFLESRQEFLKMAKDVRLLAETSDNISSLKPTNNYHFGDSYETHSHVLHAPFTEESEKKFTHNMFYRGIEGLQYIGPEKEEKDKKEKKEICK